MTSAPNNAQSEPWTTSRRLAEIHCCQAVHARTQQNRQNLQHRLVALFIPPGGFWAETQKPRETSQRGEFHTMIHGKAYLFKYENKPYETTPHTWNPCSNSSLECVSFN